MSQQHTLGTHATTVATSDNVTRITYHLAIFRGYKAIHIATVQAKHWNKVERDNLAKLFPNCYTRSANLTWPLYCLELDHKKLAKFDKFSTNNSKTLASC